MTESAPGADRPFGEPLVVLTDVDKYFGDVHVLQNINLSVRRGEVVVVLGPSGRGNSTLCRAINRLETIQSGTIAIDGQRLPEEDRPWPTCVPMSGCPVLQPFRPQDHPENLTLGPIKVRQKAAAEAKKRHGVESRLRGP